MGLLNIFTQAKNTSKHIYWERDYNLKVIWGKFPFTHFFLLEIIIMTAPIDANFLNKKCVKTGWGVDQIIMRVSF